MRSWRVLSLIFLPVLGTTGLRAAPAAMALADVLDAAQKQNPEVQAARRRWEAAAARISAGRTWPDPMVGFSREKFPGTDDMDRLMFRQEIPFPGKLSTEGRMLFHEARIAETDYREKALEVGARTRILYYRLFRADQLVRRLKGDVDLVRASLRAVQARLGSGSTGRGGAAAGGMGGKEPSGGTSGADVFALMAELGTMENMLFQESQERTLASIELNALLNRAPDSVVGTPSGPALADIPLGLPRLLELARANSPMYLKSLHEKSHSSSMVNRARLGFLPDIGLAYDRISAGGMNGSEAGVNLTVPLWFSRPRGELKAARAHAQETESMTESMRNEVEKMVSMEFTETNTHLTMARNYETTILPSAEAALKLVRRQYESGGGSFLRLVEAVRAYLSAQYEYFNELYRYGEHWALLEQWVGAELRIADLGLRNEKTGEKRR